MSNDNLSTKDQIDEEKQESPYKCSYCDQSFINRDEYEKHQFNAHRNEQTI